ncbi:hypothetical protein MNBD_BACTEROID05-314 [hydrothermal vent metagenome]|uniref:PIN domain-containing protein n=1 Tax=hydrothermal vent metagenome TaxID=652676 RepID=A0A3B0T9H6_9ZZZZ
MNEILIDTNFYTEIMRGSEESRHIVRRAKKIVMCPIVIGELFYGFKNGTREKRNVEQLQDFLFLPSVETLSITYKTSEFFALIMHQLKKSGNPIPTNDLWIAACAIEHGLAVATNDSHFKKIANLLIV